MASEDHVGLDELTPAQIALLDQNWSKANAVLDLVLELNRAHRQGGCAAWYCGDYLTLLLTRFTSGTHDLAGGNRTIGRTGVRTVRSSGQTHAPSTHQGGPT